MKRSSRLALPVKQELRSRAPTRSVERMWNRIEARTSPTPAGMSSRPAWALVVAVMLVTAGAFAGYRTSRFGRQATVAAPAPAESLSASARVSPVLPPPRAAEVPHPTPLVPATVPSVAPSVGKASPPRAPAPPWRELARTGDHAAAYGQLGPDGFAAATSEASIDDLFALADVARLSGHPRDARLPLRRVVEEHSSDPRAPLAALTLGRVELTSLAMPDAAADSLQKAITLGLPNSLAGDAYVLLADAYVAQGDRAAVQKTYDAYVRRFPKGDKEESLRAKLSRP